MIDVRHPSDGLRRRSPLGKVTLLLHDGAVLVESTVTGEYLIEVLDKGSGVVAGTPSLKAEMRV